MKRFLYFLMYVAAGLLFVAAAFFLIAVALDYRPDSEEVVFEGSTPDILPDTLRIMSWNIGYAGLGDNMDFFYDGGERVRDSESRTRENLDSIVAYIRRADPDICLLQEVDISSHRTYGIDMVKRLEEEFPDRYFSFAYNYKCFFVPIPVSSPIGRVASGVLTMSRYEPVRSVRLGYPSRFPFPVSMFNLKRCLLVSEYKMGDGSVVMIGNTHNTAYDTDNMRAQEVDFMAGMVGDAVENGIRVIIGGDWNQYPEGYVPSSGETDNECFVVAPLPMDRLSRFGSVVFDKDAKTLRYLDDVYGEQSIRTVTDFFYVTSGVSHGGAFVPDLGYRNSDHHPVHIEVCLSE